MEKLSGELVVEAKSKKESVFKAYKQVHSQASSLVSLTLQWKDLEDHFDAIHQSLECRSAKLLESEKLLRERVRQVELREEGLSLVQRKMEECEKEIERKEGELSSVRKQLEQCCEEQKVKEYQLLATRDALKDCLQLIREKGRELSSLMQSSEDCLRNYNTKTEELQLLQQELDLTKTKLGLLQNSLQECSGQLDSKTKKLHLVERSLAECSRELQMKDDDLSMVQDSLEGCIEEVASKENKLILLQQSLEERAKAVSLKDSELQSLQGKIKDCCHELQFKEEELGGIQTMIAERSKELHFKEMKLVCTKTMIEEHDQELESKKKQCASVKKLIKEHSAAFSLKERELRSLECSLRKLSEEIKSKESKLEVMECSLSSLTDIELKKKELASIQGMIEELNRTLEVKNGEYDVIQTSLENLNLELESKERKLDSIQGQIRTCQEKLLLKELEHNSIQSSILQCSNDLELKKKQLDSLQISVAAHSEELKSREKDLDSIQIHNQRCEEELRLKELEHTSIQSSITEYSKDLELKRKQLDSLQISVAARSKELNYQKKELDLIQKKRGECLRELKEKQLYSFKSAIEECSQTQEKRCHAQLKELELRQEKLDLAEKSLEKRFQEVELRERTSVHFGVNYENQNYKLANESALATCANSQSRIAVDGKNLLMFLYQHFQELDKVCHKVMTIVQTSTGAAELVLEAVEGFYPPDVRNGDRGFDTDLIRRSCIFLLEHLIRASATVEPQVRDTAMKLAVKWKSKLKVSPEHGLEVLGFLQLLVAYKLASAFSASELQGLVNSVSQYRKADELCQALGISEISPGSVNSIQMCRIKTEQSENVPMHNANDFSIPVPPPNTVSDRRSFQLFSNELLNENDVISQEIASALRISPNPTKHILDVMEGSYSQYLKSTDMNFRTDLMRLQILLLEQLMRISQSITPEVKFRAMKLATLWNMNLRDKAMNFLEVLGFLHFLAAYKLVTLFSESDIMNLAEVISLNDKAPQLYQSLGLADRVTASAGVPYQQLHRDKKRAASSAAVDEQCQHRIPRCRYQRNNQDGPM